MCQSDREIERVFWRGGVGRENEGMVEFGKEREKEQ